MAVFHGVNINWGVNTNIEGVVGLMQTRDHNFNVNAEVITDGGDTPVSKVYWGQYEEATFTYVATDGLPAAGNWWGGSVKALNDAGGGNAQYVLPDIGQSVYVSDVVNNQLDGNWMVDAISTHTSNTTATRVTLKLSRYPHLDAAITNE